MEVKRIASDPDNQTGHYLLRCRCGRSTKTTIPLAEGAQFICAGCSSSGKEKSRLKRIRDEVRNTALRQRLETFSKRPLKGNEHEWFELAQDLKVDAVALEAVVAVVQEGKWRNSTAPLMLVRVNVERRSKQWQDPFAENGRLKHPQIFSAAPTREDRASLKKWTEIQRWYDRVTPDDIKAASPTLHMVKDEEERGVLCARALGLTRAQYLSGVSDVERRKRAAAWKRLSRHGLPNDLRQELQVARAARMGMQPGFEDHTSLKAQGIDWDELPSKATPARRCDY